MNSTTIINKLTELKYIGFKDAYLRQLEDVNYHSLGFEDRLYNLLDSQAIHLQDKRIIMNSRLSKIKDKQAFVQEIDYNARREINKDQILSLISMNFIRSYQNIVITGKTGTGKSYLAQALGNRAIVDGFTVYYIRAANLLEEIKIARLDGTYTNLIKKYTKYKLLIIDDFGVSPISSDDATNLFEVIESRFEISSTLISSQLPVKQWYEYLNNNTVADAILDRISNSSHRVELKGPSMREIKSNININY